MLKQKARTVALAVLVTDLALTAVSLPVTWGLRHGVLTSALPTVFPLPLYPLNQYVPLLAFILPVSLPGPTGAIAVGRRRPNGGFGVPSGHRVGSRSSPTTGSFARAVALAGNRRRLI